MSRAHVLAATMIALSACAATTTQTTVSTSNPVAGFVADMPSFDAFIATQPTPEQFKARYPDVTLALPGSMNTKELRMNNSRYFAQLDAQGRITGGKFQ